MDHRAAAWRGGAVCAGAAAQGALSDISCDRRHVAGLRARVRRGRWSLIWRWRCSWRRCCWMRLSIPRCATSGTTGCRYRRWCWSRSGSRPPPSLSSRTGFARTCPGRSRSRSAPSWRRPTPRRPPRSCARSTCPTASQKILEGESLLNDASALLIYRVAVGLVAAEHMKVQRVRAVHCAGAVRKPALPASCSRGSGRRSRAASPRRRAPSSRNSPARSWCGSSPSISVCPAFSPSSPTRSRSPAPRPSDTPARLRVASYAVWETVVFVLNVLAFILIGMQLSPIWSGSMIQCG